MQKSFGIQHSAFGSITHTKTIADCRLPIAGEATGRLRALHDLKTQIK